MRGCCCALAKVAKGHSCERRARARDSTDIRAGVYRRATGDGGGLMLEMAFVRDGGGD